MTLQVHLRHALADLELDIAFEAPQGVTSLFGRSGAGKTSVINAVAGLLRPNFAQISLDGAVLTDTEAGLHVPVHKRRIGYVFQDARLFPHLDVGANLGYGARAGGMGADKASFERILQILGIGGLLHRRPGELSGGEKQRVAIGRALLARPRLLLLDEPLAALDDERKAEILPYLERIRDEGGVPMVHVSHSPAEVARLATTVVVIEAGRVIRSGSGSEVFSDPSVSPTGERGMGALLSAKVVAHHDDGLTEVDLNGVRMFLARAPQPVGTTLRVRVAAHDVILSRDVPQNISALNVIPGTISAIQPGDGAAAVVSLATRAGPILARITRRSVAHLELAEGMTCHAVLKSVAIAMQDIGTDA